MAKIELVPSASTASTTKTNKKRKLKDVHADDDGAGRSAEAESPTSKFKKLDISQIGKRHSNPRPVVSPPLASAVATDNQQPQVAKAPKKNQKRKQQSAQDADANASKKAKNHVKGGDINDATKPAAASSSSAAAGGDVDEDMHEPTTAELNAADRPENVPQIETTRQKKRDKHAKVQQTARVDSTQREHLRNREYLLQWRDDRAAWKFNKLRQISVTKALFRDEDPLDEDTWQLAMEYLCGTKGQLRQLMRDAAQKVIDDIDTRMVAEHNDALVQSVNYTRARSFMQMLE